MPPRQTSSAAARKAAVEEAAEQSRQAAIGKLRELGAQALALKDSEHDCRWTLPQVAEAAEAVSQTGGGWVALGVEGRAGLAALFGLALRRSCPAPSIGVAGIFDDLRDAYASLRAKLAAALKDVDTRPADQMPSPPARRLCAALLKVHILRGYAALLASATASLEAQRPRPPQATFQAATALGEELASLVSVVARLSKTGSTADSNIERLWSEQSELRATELAASGLFEHWARLALALAACEGGEDASFAQAAHMLSAQKALRAVFKPIKAWTSPALLHLLTSHLLALASALDGGPSFGLPLAWSSPAGAAGASSSAAPALVPMAPVPLVDRDGRRLRPGDSRPAGMLLVKEAVTTWEEALGDLTRCVEEDYSAWRRALTLPSGNAVLPPRPPPMLSGPRLFESTALLHTTLYAETVVSALAEGAGADSTNSTQRFACAKQASAIGKDCQKLGEALMRNADHLRCCPGFELGMRVAGAAARNLGRGGDLDARSPQELEALYALHEPAQWRQPVQQVQAPGQAPSGFRPTVRLRLSDAVELGLQGLRLAWAALGAPLSVYDPARGAEGAPAWVVGRVEAYWRVALAWAGQGELLDVGGLVQVLALARWGGTNAGPPARPGLAVAAALSAGYLPTLERVLRQRVVPVFGQMLVMHSGSSWVEIATFAEPRQLAALAATVAKQLSEASAAQQYNTLRDYAAFAAAAFAPGACGLAGAVVRYTDRPPVQERWPVAMSAVAAALLPTAYTVLKSVQSAALEQGKVSDPFAAARDLACLLLSWVPSLLAADYPPLGPPLGPAPACERQATEPPASAAVAAAAGTSASEGEGWLGSLLPACTDLPALLGGAMKMITAEGSNSKLVRPFQAATWAFVTRAPQPLRRAESRTAAMLAALRPANKNATAYAIGIRASQLQTWRDLLGKGGPAARPELLAAVERALGGGGPGLAAVEDGTGAGAGTGAGRGTVAYTGAGPSGSAAAAAGAGGGGARAGEAGAALPEGMQRYAGAASLLLPYREALRLVPGCSHPGCTNLAGPSEAQLPLKGCGGGCGGAARYCSRECQQAHWREGHKAECQGAARAAAA
ncbi:hypothetical protein HYH03_005966 [Edaphochlamys debaryana]|uniref:MYND-type domain-containing protein n=1 Tax=Edaphochlamys debaryana TaxID=47281 RepID=A0A836C0P0_9CHLO|nr:hypothetical protein HYH03_005966 [Edaphochlamys debaryana]|eukprot:KAG2496046.1 hypothetical protein HYH03_005966 [Edaphochlamys debaryana]